MKSIFLFDGGNYKIDIDDGRERVPLTRIESELLFIDPELLSETGTGHGAELEMSEFPELFSDLQVGDQIFMGVLPDSAFYRGIWVHGYNKVQGFKIDVDFVPVRDIYDAVLLGTDLSAVERLAGTPVQSFDFTNGVKEATKDAVQKSVLWNNDENYHELYRNNLGQVATPFEAVHAGLGMSLYIRVTVVELGALGKSEDSCCSKCGGDSYPIFKAGAVLDTLCGEKQRVTRFCCGIDAPCHEAELAESENQAKAVAAAEARATDTDSDGLSDFAEVVSDTDGDDISDVDEGAADTDSDGALDFVESNVNDSDSDGLVDNEDPDS